METIENINKQANAHTHTHTHTLFRPHTLVDYTSSKLFSSFPDMKQAYPHLLQYTNARLTRVYDAHRDNKSLVVNSDDYIQKNTFENIAVGTRFPYDSCIKIDQP